MRILKTATTLILAAAMSAAAAARAESGFDAACGLQESLYSLFENNKNSIVKVYAKKEIHSKDSAGNEAKTTILDVGSGFIASKTGAVMTSAFITRGAQKLWIEYNGRLLDAENVGFDPITTVSVIKIAGNFKSADLPVVLMDSAAEPVKPATVLVSISHEMGFETSTVAGLTGSAAESVKPATVLVSISHEMGFAASPRMGMATGQNIEFGGRFLPTVYVRTNIPAPRGSTGGAVFTLDGKFAGMIVASLPEIGGSFILPARAAAKIRDDIMICGEPIYSWFGLLAKDVPDPANGTKVVVEFVAENAPAKKAGFMVGDEIVEINSKKVSNNTELRAQTFFIRPSETAVFKVLRNGKSVRLELVTERMASDIIKSAEANIAPAPPQESERAQPQASADKEKSASQVKDAQEEK